MRLGEINMSKDTMDYNEFDSLFYPNSIAVVGASPVPGNAGATMLSMMLNHGFPGKLYPVNRSARDVLGLKAYSSIKEIPGPVDYALLQVPAEKAIDAISDCSDKGVKFVSLLAAGFGESEDKTGKELEQDLAKAACQRGIRFLGPNCMGFYCPKSHVTFGNGFPRESGPVGVMCQSGGNSVQLVRSGTPRGIRFSKIISFGNAADINEAELMEYFARDPDTKLIIAYIEGVRDGQRFFRALKDATLSKPVIVLKGGQSDTGCATIQSHTGSLAGSNHIWSSLLKQTGAIQAYNIDECIDIASACLFLKRPASRKIAVMGFGGAASVQAADDCCRAGLILPLIADPIKQELQKFIPTAGNIFRNPLDVTRIYFDPVKLGQAATILGGWSDIDILLLHIRVELTDASMVEAKTLEPTVQGFIDAARETGKPTVLAIYSVYSDSSYQGYLKAQQMCMEAGITCYPSVYRAANAIGKTLKYYKKR
jgi:acyl-CoA synthetase (NDP forming)